MARKINKNSRASIKRGRIFKAMVNKPLLSAPVPIGITKRAMRNLMKKT